MSSIFDNPPTFSSGQVLSASAHLNSLQNVVHGISNARTGYALPFCGIRTMDSFPATLEWRGYIRHKSNTFVYHITNLENYSMTISINGEVIKTHATAGVYTASVDISDLELTVNQFYEVVVTSGRYIQVWSLGEIHTLNLPTLATFADETTPTAAEWQDLSDYTAELLTSMAQTSPCLTQLSAKIENARWVEGTYPLVGSFAYYNNKLQFGAFLQAPYWRATGDVLDTGQRWTCLRLYIGGVLVAKLMAGDTALGGFAEDGSEFYQGANVIRGGTHEFNVEIDLATYAPSLSLGTTYDIYAQAFDSTLLDDIGRAHVLYLFAPPGDVVIGGWSTFSAWAHGNYIKGSTSTPNAQAIKTNLELLGALTPPINFAAINCISQDGVTRLWGVRKYRYLHHRQLVEDTAPVLRYTYAGKENEVTLTDSYDAWQVHDLEAVANLYPGTLYYIDGAKVALEDSIA